MGRVYASVWLHPWDALDEGVGTVLGRVADWGLNAVNLAVSYHCGKYVLPHNPKRRVYFAEEGVIYFQPSLEKYDKTKLKPLQSANYSGIDILDLAIKEAENYGVKVNAWTVCLHNARLGRQHPEATMVNLYGDRDVNFLCPNNGNARNFLLGLVDDLASNYGLGAIQLESSSYPWGLYHGDHHEMYGVPIEPLASLLLSTCFCQDCIEKAGKLGFNLAKIREEAKRMVDDWLSTPSHVLEHIGAERFLEKFISWMTSFPELYDLMRFRNLVTAEIFGEAREVIRAANSKVGLHCVSAELLMEGVDPNITSRYVNAFDVPIYTKAPEEVYYKARWLKHGIGEGAKLYVALRVNYPMASTRDVLISEILSAMKAGADGITFYNYGWTPLENLQWVKEGLEKIK